MPSLELQPLQDDAAAQRCDACGYDLRGLTETRCPECGRHFVRVRRPRADVPWLRRHALGGWNAYWQTVWQVARHPRRLGEQVWLEVEVDDREANRFRRLTIAVAVISMVLMLVPAFFSAPPVIALAIVVIVALPSWFFFEWATIPHPGIQEPPWWVEPRERFGRLHNFVCAPLALSPVVVLPLWSAVALHVSLVFTAAAAGLLTFLWWITAAGFHQQAGKLNRIEAIGMALLLPIYWGFLAFAAAMGASILAWLAFVVGELFFSP